MLTVLVAILLERKVLGRMQMRPGPNRVGPWGLLQSLVDGVKLALKEGLIPAGVDKSIYLVAPVISVVPAFIAFAVIPMGGEVSIFGHRTALQLTDLPVAVLYVLAVTSIGVYGIVLAGWASGSTYPLLGGLRSSAQVISYEIAMALSFAAVFLYAGTMSTSGIVASQQGLWYVFLLLPSFLVYLTSMVGETNRAPFDLPEAEGELVGGFHTEYSSIKFAMFMLAEYVNMTTVSALATTMFLGGWHAPWPINMWDGANTRLVAAAVVRRQGVDLPVLLLLAARHAAPDALRPVHGAGLEGPDPGLAGVDHDRRHRPHPAQPGLPPSDDRTDHRRRRRRVDCALRVLEKRAGQNHSEDPRAGRGCGRIPGATAAHAAELQRRRQMPKFLDAIAGFGGHVRHDVQEAAHRGVPGEAGSGRQALPRPASAQPVSRRAGEVHRLRAVRLGLPGRRHLRRGRRQHRGGTLLARRALRPRLPDQLSAVHRLRAVHRGLPDPGADDDQRVRDGRRQPRRLDLGQGQAARPAAAGHASPRPTTWRRAAPTRTTTGATSSRSPEDAK